MSTSTNVVVFGAINIDIGVQTKEPYRIADSNIVQSTMGVGGVGANIASNLAALGNAVSLVTAIGDGPLYDYAITTLTRRGIDVSDSLVLLGLPTNLYFNIMDEQGNLYLGLNDMMGMEALSPEWIDTKRHLMDQAKVVVVDCNLPPATLQAIVSNKTNQFLVADVVSIAKAKRILPILNEVDILKLNQLEYEYLVEQGFNAENKPNLKVIITSRDRPVQLWHGMHHTTFDVPNVPDIVSTSGAGDALLSGIIHGILHNQTLENAIPTGIELAQQVLGHAASVWKE